MDSEQQAVITVKGDHPTERLSGSGSCVPYPADPWGYRETPRDSFYHRRGRRSTRSAPRVQEACEGWDGVSSLHNAKVVQVIARLYWEGASRAWVESSSR